MYKRQVGLLVDYEWTHRQNRRQARLLKAASLKIKACMEDVDYSHPRGLDRGLMENLASGQWLLSHQNVLISGPAGVGKTYLLCALTNQASGLSLIHILKGDHSGQCCGVAICIHRFGILRLK